VVIIVGQLAVPGTDHQRVLPVGSVPAPVVRAVLIAAGAAALATFAVGCVIFDAILTQTGIGLVRLTDADPDPKLVVHQGGARHRPPRRTGPLTLVEAGAWRPAAALLPVLVTIGPSDLLVALDSIPRRSPARRRPHSSSPRTPSPCLGLRALVVVLQGRLDRLDHLWLVRAVILIGLGVNLVLFSGHAVNPPVPHLGTTRSPLVIL
jgi:tellurite resistance protein TerC